MSIGLELQNTLYVTTGGTYVHLDNNTVRIDIERETRLRIPIHHLGGIVCFGDVMLSPALIARCAEDGVGVCLLDRNGRFRARIEGPLSGNVLLRRAQFRTQEDTDSSLALARQFVLAKLRNTRHVLLRGVRDCKSESDREQLGAAAKHLDASLRSAGNVASHDALRGVEGEAARTYFGVFDRLVRPDLRTHFAPAGRSRRPPRDPCNALLSFLYTLLVNDCRSALETVGLDPQVGFLHALRPGRPALALDLAEEFRALLADRAALTLVNRGQIGPEDFRTTEGGAVLLDEGTRRTVATHWQERKQRSAAHPLLETDVPHGLLPTVQAHLLARALRGDTEGYLPYAAR
ncbi:MAG TPA: type I-C CRISPR-associated endonuclease Cas1c [Xanthomonadaceae bacterium]|nr:type I-C CRISPR-associated endonuclease Cas1c [Xanthomonadaceae bacterium]